METTNLVTAKYGYALISWGSYLLDSPLTIKKGDPGIHAITYSMELIPSIMLCVI
jgi:hypothetical protein